MFCVIYFLINYASALLFEVRCAVVVVVVVTTVSR